LTIARYFGDSDHIMRRLSIVLAIALGSPASAAHAQEDHASDRPHHREAEEEGFEYTIREGETLTAIAVRFGLSLEALVSQNPGLDPDRIRAGRSIRIVNGLRRAEHAVREGESLSQIASHYEVHIEDLLRWNPRVDRDRIRIGRTLVVFTRVPDSRSQSIGTPDRGELSNARQLPTRHPAIYVRTPSHAYGTDEAVRWIVDAFEDLRRIDPEAPRVEIHDLSREDGGPLHGHHSHESGRDADIAYFRRDCGETCSFRRIGADELDAARQWALFQRWLERDRVVAIFVDHDLQRALYEHARASGVSARDLGRWFQYPRGPGHRFGVIRHHPRHADHFHVRFVCHESDPDCR
jgi:LysM repeat protein